MVLLHAHGIQGPKLRVKGLCTTAPVSEGPTAGAEAEGGQTAPLGAGLTAASRANAAGRGVGVVESSGSASVYCMSSL